MCVSTFSFRESESVFGACGRVYVTFRSYSRFKKCGYPIIEQTVTRNQLKYSCQSAMPRHIYQTGCRLGFLSLGFAREEGRKNSASILKYFEQAPQPLATRLLTVDGLLYLYWRTAYMSRRVT